MKSKGKVFLLDDEELIVTVLSKALKMEGYEICAATETSGIIDKISIFTTTLTTPDNKEVIVPNGAIIGSNITNYSARPTRRVDMVFGVSYDDDIRKAKQLLQDILAADERILKDPAPVVAVGALAESSVNFLVRPWAKTADYWAVYWDTTEAVKTRFDEAGISIPYPQVDVHVGKPE